MASYEEVLHLLRYRNWHSRFLLDRKFKLVCSELNGRYVSNEFQVEVSVGLQLRRASYKTLIVGKCQFLEHLWLRLSQECSFSSLGGAVRCVPSTGCGS